MASFFISTTFAASFDAFHSAFASSTAEETDGVASSVDSARRTMAAPRRSVVDLLATRATVRDAVVRWETAEMVNIVFVRFDVRVVRVGVFGSCVGRGAARVSMSDVSWCLRCLFASVVTSRVWFFGFWVNRV